MMGLGRNMSRLRPIVLICLVAVVFCASAEEHNEDSPTPKEREAQPKPEPPGPDPARAREPGPRRDPADRWRLGLRTALMLPGSGEWRDYGSSVLLGVTLSTPKREGSRASLEFGLDFGGWAEADGYSSQLLGARLGVLFSVWEGSGRERAYLLSGLGGFLEFVKDEISGEDYVNAPAVLDFGGGYVFPGGRLDVRFSYSIMMGSENQKGQALLGIGYAF